LKAREIAKTVADELAASIRSRVQTIGEGNVNEVSLVPFLRDEAEKLRVQAPTDAKAQRRALPFPIRGVCPLTSISANPAAGAGLPSFGAFDRPISPGQVRGFLLLPSENIKYPTADLINSLIDERTKPPGTVLVSPDQPKDTYYVITLVNRDEKTDNDFLTEVTGATSSIFGGPTIMAAFRRNSENEAVQSVLALLKIEFKYEESEEQKKKLDTDATRGES
jgi:hypothetical protein